MLTAGLAWWVSMPPAAVACELQNASLVIRHQSGRDTIFRYCLPNQRAANMMPSIAARPESSKVLNVCPQESNYYTCPLGQRTANNNLAYGIEAVVGRIVGDPKECYYGQLNQSSE